MSPTRWLRVSYWVGAIADGLAAAAMFSPALGSAIYDRSDFEPGVEFQYAMRLGGSLMLGWTLLLLWADRKPLERRGVLPLTVIVIAGLASAGAYAVSHGFIELEKMLPTWGLQAFLTLLFLFSYVRAGRAARAVVLGEGQMSLERAAEEFLATRRVAVAGVSRSSGAPANLIFKKLRDSGYEVYALNPNAEMVEGARAYGSLAELPQTPEAVMVATHPDQALGIARQCQDAGVRYVWFHQSVDGGSYSAEADALCRRYGATVIPGGCPMMHLQPVDLAHRCMRGVLGAMHKLPEAIEQPKA
jgi:predicted CoA-binding protein